jgi:hypothetical protein
VAAARAGDRPDAEGEVAMKSQSPVRVRLLAGLKEIALFFDKNLGK